MSSNPDSSRRTTQAVPHQSVLPRQELTPPKRTASSRKPAEERIADVFATSNAVRAFKREHPKLDPAYVLQTLEPLYEQTREEIERVMTVLAELERLSVEGDTGAEYERVLREEKLHAKLKTLNERLTDYHQQLNIAHALRATPSEQSH